MNEQIEILILGVGRTKDKKKSILDYAIVDLKESTNRVGYNVCQAWFDNEEMFNQINSADIGSIVKADVRFEVGQNGHAKMVIDRVYN